MLHGEPHTRQSHDAGAPSDVPRPASGSVKDLSSRLAQVWPGGAIVLLVFLVYLPALRGGFVWDDDSWTIRIVNLLRDTAGLRSIWFRPTAMQQYYPLTGTSFWLDYHLWKFWPLPYHVENVALHAVAALLFARALRRLQVPGAWLASALFALHPMMVESAAWITERKNVLSLSLCLAAFLAYWRYAEDDATDTGPASAETHRSRFYVLALLLFIGALLAKTVVCSLPAAILLVVWWRRGRLRWRKDVVPTLPFFAAALALCGVTAWVESTSVGARGGDYTLTIAQRLLVAGRAFWFYLGKLLWPANLSFIYPRWQPDPTALGQWLYPAAALAMLSALWLARHRTGRGPVTALLFFAGTLSPVLGFVNVYFMRYAFVCDHWVYLPSLGVIALVASGATLIGKRLGSAQWLRFGTSSVILLIVGVLVLLTWRQSSMYTDLESLWRTTIRRNPECWMAYNSLGNALFRKGDADDAIANLRQAIRLKPDLAEAHTSLGVALASRGNVDGAIAEFQTAIHVNPGYADAHYDLGMAFGQVGDLDGAIAQFREAVRLRPGFTAAQRRLDRAVRRKHNDPSANAEPALRAPVPMAAPAGPHPGP